MMHTLLIIVDPLICSMPMVVESHDSKPYHLLHKAMPCLNIRRYTACDVVFKRKVQTILHPNIERATVKDAVEENRSIEKNIELTFIATPS